MNEDERRIAPEEERGADEIKEGNGPAGEYSSEGFEDIPGKETVPEGDRGENAHTSSPEDADPALKRAGRVYTPDNPEGLAYGFHAGEEEEPPAERRRERDASRRRKRAGRWTAVLLAAVFLLGSFGMGFAGAAVYSRLGGNGTVESPKSVIYQSVIRSVGEENGETAVLSVNDVAKIAAPSVVEIVTESVSYNAFFGQVPVSGAGSGVILSEDGLIVTNYHVVAGASQVTVTLSDGKNYEAKIVGEDDQDDLALIRINAGNLPAAVLGTSGDLKVGDGVVAIGNPLGKLGGTVTDGIVSALDREIEIDGQSYRLLQTNAAINPGNSGGGLFNMRGELVGIVNAKVSESSVEGLGFAIPVDHAKGIIEEISTYGYIRGRIDLGAELIEINDALTARYYNVTEGGVYVSSVSDAGTGLRAGDLILAADGKEILTMADFEEALGEHRAGDTLSLTVRRRVSRREYEESELSFILKEKIPEDLGR